MESDTTCTQIYKKYKRNDRKHKAAHKTEVYTDSLCDAFTVLNKLLTAQRSDQTS